MINSPQANSLGKVRSLCTARIVQPLAMNRCMYVCVDGCIHGWTEFSKVIEVTLCLCFASVRVNNNYCMEVTMGELVPGSSC